MVLRKTVSKEGSCICRFAQGELVPHWRVHITIRKVRKVKGCYILCHNVVRGGGSLYKYVRN